MKVLGDPPEDFGRRVRRHFWHDLPRRVPRNLPTSLGWSVHAEVFRDGRVPRDPPRDLGRRVRRHIRQDLGRRVRRHIRQDLQGRVY